MASKKSQGRLHTPSKDSSSKAQLSFLLNEEQNEQQHISIDMGLPSLSVRDASWKRQYSSSSHVNNQASRNSNPQGHSNHLMDIEYPEQGLLSMPVSSPIHSHVSSSLSIPEDQSIYSSGGPSAMDVSRSTKGDSAGNTNTVTSTDRRGVRKKRQRKFVCDTCGFGFYTNSDLQKVRLLFSFFLLMLIHGIIADQKRSPFNFQLTNTFFFIFFHFFHFYIAREFCSSYAPTF